MLFGVFPCESRTVFQVKKNWVLEQIERVRKLRTDQSAMELRIQRLCGAKGGGFGFGVLFSWDSFKGVDILVGTYHIAVGRWSRYAA